MLELYDQLRTVAGLPPGAGGPAMTGFSHGFYYTLASGGGLSLEDHDANVTQRLQQIHGDTAFLVTDTVGRFQGLQEGLDEVRARVFQLPTEFPSFPEFPTDIASRDDVRDAARELSETLLILFGLQPCPEEAAAICETAIFVQDLATRANVEALGEILTDLQDRLDTIETAIDSFSVESPVVVHAIEVPDPPSPKHRRWIVETTRDGVLVDADLTRVLAIRTKKQHPGVAEDVTYLATATAIGPGLLDLTVEVGAGNGEGITYQIEVRHIGPDATVQGSTLVATR